MAPAPRKPKPWPKAWTDGLPFWLQNTLPFAVVIAVTALVVWAGVLLNGGQSRRIILRVVSIRFYVGSHEASTTAWVAAPDGSTVQVWIPDNHGCRVGSGLPVWESKGFFGKRYTGYGFGCRGVAGGEDGWRSH